MPSRVTYTPVPGAEKLFTQELNDYLVTLHDALDGREDRQTSCEEGHDKSRFHGRAQVIRFTEETTLRARLIQPGECGR